MKLQVLALAALMTMGMTGSGFADSAHHEGKEKCRADYKLAKAEAKKKSSHDEREAAEKAAKQSYKDCKKALPK